MTVMSVAQRVRVVKIPGIKNTWHVICESTKFGAVPVLITVTEERANEVCEQIRAAVRELTVAVPNTSGYDQDWEHTSGYLREIKK